MSNEMQLKYGCNPNQKPSRVYMADGSELPIEVLCGRPGYINLLALSTAGSSLKNSKLLQVCVQLLPSSTFHLPVLLSEDLFPMTLKRYTG